MAMTQKCAAMVQAAAKAAGRATELTKNQLADIDARIKSTARRLAYQDRAAWQALSADDRTLAAARQAMADIKAEAARKVANAQRQILKTQATETRVAQAHGEKQSNRLVADLENTADYISGIKQEAMGGLMNLLDAVKSSQGASPGRRISMWVFNVQNPAMVADLAREVFRNADGSTGNTIAQKGAKAWLDSIETLRQRFNSAGGDVGRLDYGYIPQPHDAAKVRGAGAQKWIDSVLPKLDRNRMLDENGVPLTDADARSMLQGVHETISTEGINKMEPGTPTGTGARANSGGDARELHFKDSEAYLSYLNEYGAGSMFEAMQGHVGKLARDIGLVEKYGPNPNAQMNLQFQLASKADVAQVTNLPRTFGLKPQSYWANLNGTAGTPQSARLALIASTARNIQSFGKLGGATVSSITDLATYFVGTHFNKLPYWDAVANIGKVGAPKILGGKDWRDFLTVHGIIAESMAGDMNRWFTDNIKAGWSGRLAQATMRLSLMNAWSDTLRRAFSLTMMQGMARMAGKDWADIGQWSRDHFLKKGITAEDWEVIRQAQLTNFRGVDHLTPESIRATGHPDANAIVSKVLGFIQDESEYAVMNPDLATKSLANWGGLQSGTGPGELARSVMQFKSFPIAMVSRHWRRMMDLPAVTDNSAPGGLGGPQLVNRLAYGGAMMVTTTALGMVAYQAKQILSGKDPAPMVGPHAGKAWTHAVAQGGGLSIAGDMLLSDSNDSFGDWSGSTAKTLLGPTAGTVFDALKIPKTNIDKALAGKQTHTAAQSLAFARSNTPFLGLWYAKAAVDHAGMQALQENLSPGYLGKMKQRAAKDNQAYWWEPGNGGPERTPDIGKAFGQ